MLRLIPIFLIALTMTLAVACGDDDSSSQPAAVSPTATITPNGGPTTITPTPASDDRKTEGPSESPGETTPEPTAPGDVPTPPPSAEGTPAPQVDEAYAGQFQGQPITPEECIYNLTAGQVTCPDRGIFAISPAMTGQDIACNIWIINGTPELIQCTSQEPLETNYYQVPE
jgi:hypothetical protein